MEDYQSAFLQRHQDTEILCESNRKIAAMHFGGITIECLLKSMILASVSSQEWKTKSNNPGHTITNPGHSLTAALTRNNCLYSRVQNYPDVIKWINIVEKPVENPSQNFIDMRYSSSEPNDDKYKEWLSAYQSLKRWLQKQATQL
ncbi:MAG: hypothetical protein EHM73_06520 [Chroococcales cyanobacterium metabat2.561]|jgi:hypothetical protein|nr:MAG: hypothetical protein EHM73_06520 [Chroococcales cyanobacterium metabat2.561]TRU97784.1 MAG: hypothetical protein EWV73_16320 [Microcystis wesenbergii Mw_QC_B_20070930_S4D]TRV13059.1 MAG: hypothetical protein EWV89_12140 [Microcystis wesenbergii Mw_QC_B_20070930_S4]